jgi:hypothetical protein
MAGSGFVLWFSNWSLQPAEVGERTALRAALVRGDPGHGGDRGRHSHMVIFDPDAPWTRPEHGRASASHLQETRPRYLRLAAQDGAEARQGGARLSA